MMNGIAVEIEDSTALAEDIIAVIDRTQAIDWFVARYRSHVRLVGDMPDSG